MYRNSPASSLLLLALMSLPAKTQGDLARYHDKNRLLLVFAPSAADPHWQRQDALLAGSRAQFADRELLRFDIFERAGKHRAGTPVPPEGPSASGHEEIGLRVRYHIRPGSFRVLLIGKDGHVAFGGPAPLALSDLTGRIDRMPMRRDEMRRDEMQRRRTGAGR
jgi:hypothetical protein